MKNISAVIAPVLAVVLLLTPLITAPVAAQTKVIGPTDRTVLPIPAPKVPAITTFDARNVTPPPRFVVEAPKGAPNVLIVLIDDMGFGMSEAFGGPIRMPATPPRAPTMGGSPQILI